LKGFCAEDVRKEGTEREIYGFLYKEHGFVGIACTQLTIEFEGRKF
jgi:hypothetical protein